MKLVVYGLNHNYEKMLTVLENEFEKIKEGNE